LRIAFKAAASIISPSGDMTNALGVIVYRTFQIAWCFWLLLSGVAAAQYPDRIVRVIVPFAPGGVTDVAARVVGQQLAALWGQQVIIENKPGAGGFVGVETAIRAAPDGYTVLMATNGEVVIIPAISAKPKYDAQKDLLPIAMVTATPYAWVANAGAGINTLQDLIAAAKAKPGGLAYSTAGHGSTMHLATEQFAAILGIKLLHVPYRGGAPAASAIIAGDVPVGMVAMSALNPVIDSGKAKLLAVTSSKRLAHLPNVPTVPETGVIRDYEAAIWTGMFAPAETPPDIAAKIEADVLKVLKEPALVDRLAAVGVQVVGMSGSEMRTHMKAELERVSKAANEAHIRLE
jgi:tripartite-type tricarboxylate transporter receptor subunit TctC